MNVNRLLLCLAAIIIFARCSGKDVADKPLPNASVAADSVAVKKPSTQLKKPLTLAFVGDIMMGTTFPEDAGSAYLPANDGANLFADCDSLLRAADITAGNLEGTLLDSGGTPKRCSNPKLCYIFRTPTRYVGNLVNAGFDLLSIANNHANDSGSQGVASTQKTLKEAGIAYAGRAEGARTAIIEKNGYKIGYAAFGHSRGTMSINNLASVKQTISDLKKNSDIVIVSFHGGGEGPKYSHVANATETAFGENRGNVVKFAHAAVDAGADVVYGHGPHVPRAAELYNDHIIFYSLGNFCTPYRISLGGVSGLAPVAVVEIDADGRFIKGKIHSFRQQKGKGPRLDATNEAARQIKRLSATDFPASPLKIATDGTLSR